MQQTLTAKIRLYPTHEQIALFKAVTKEYQRLCNIVSQWYFDGYFNANQKVFQKTCTIICEMSRQSSTLKWYSQPIEQLRHDMTR